MKRLARARLPEPSRVTSDAPAKREIEKDEDDQEEDEPADAHLTRSGDRPGSPWLDPVNAATAATRTARPSHSQLTPA